MIREKQNNGRQLNSQKFLRETHALPDLVNDTGENGLRLYFLSTETVGHSLCTEQNC